VRQVLTERATGSLESTLRSLVSIGVAGHARQPRLQRVLTEELPALGYRDVEAVDAPLFDSMRRFLRTAAPGVKDVDFALWMIATISGGVLHRAAVDRPEDLASGRITEELVALLTHYLHP
jgi:hypothetical protein